MTRKRLSLDDISPSDGKRRLSNEEIDRWRGTTYREEEGKRTSRMFNWDEVFDSMDRQLGQQRY